MKTFRYPCILLYWFTMNMNNYYILEIMTFWQLLVSFLMKFGSKPWDFNFNFTACLIFDSFRDLKKWCGMSNNVLSFIKSPRLRFLAIWSFQLEQDKMMLKMASSTLWDGDIMGDFSWTFSKGEFLWTLLVTSCGHFWWHLVDNFS